jgi:hypothetical protein
MTSIDTRVQLLNVRAPDEATAQRIGTLIEETIRMAAVDLDIQGQVLVVRQLDLSVLPRAAPPAAVAHAVEAAVQRVVANAVSGDEPAAATAPMVYFKNDSSVVLALAQRVASNRSSAEWFWPSVVKGWTPNAPLDRAISLLIERALGTSGGVVTLARVVETLASTGVIDRLLENLSPSDGRALLRAIGWTGTMMSGHDPETPHAPMHAEPHAELHARPHSEAHSEPHAAEVPAHAQRLVQRWIARWGDDARDPRALWLGAMVLVADRPGRAATAELPESVRAWLTMVMEQSREAGGEGPQDGAAARALQRDELIADARAWLQSHPRSPLDSLFGGGPPLFRASRESFDDETVDRRAPHDDSPDDERAQNAPTWRNPRSTRYAGFLFLIPLLTRVGVTGIVANDPGLLDRDWPGALLLRLARRLGIAPDDPAVMCVAGRPRHIAPADRALSAEVVRAVRIRLRNEVGVPLRALVQRDGAVVASPTTIDVLLQHASTDAVHPGDLEADPPEAPWLGRSVIFHRRDAVDVNA